MSLPNRQTSAPLAPVVVVLALTPESLTHEQRAVVRAVPLDRPIEIATSNHRKICRQLENLGALQVLSPGASSTVVVLTNLGRQLKRALLN